MKKLNLSIIIVNYKTPQLIIDCVESIKRFTRGINFEIIIVDNKSDDGSEQLISKKHDDIIWIQMDDNAGTSRGYNAGIKKAKGDYILILNSDTVVKDNAIGETFNYHLEKEKHFKVGMTSCQLKDFNNKILFNSNITFPSIKKHLYNNPICYKLNLKPPTKFSEEERNKLHETEHQPAWIGIAFGIIKKKLFTEEKFWFDEDFFMYSDEVDWCYRLNKKGYKHFFTPNYTIYHINCGSPATNDWRAGQIALSEFLHLFKTYGFIRYKLMLYSIAYFLSLKPKEMYNIERDIMNRYANKIPKNYTKKISSGKTYLKYEING